MAALLFGAVSALFESAFAARGSFEQTGGALFSLSLVALLIATAQRGALPMGVRVGAVLLVGVYIAAKTWNVLFAYSDTSVFPSMVSRMAPWGPVDLFMAWILFDSGRALYGTVAVYYLALLTPIAAFGAVRGASAIGSVLGVIGPLVLASAATTALLVALVRLRDEYARVQVSHDAVLRLAQTDVLTGLPNRRFLEGELVREIARAARGQEALGLLLIDLDHFKQINDEAGHSAGDDALVAAAHRMRAALRAGDRIGRLGGEEFLVVAPATSAGEALALAARLRMVIAGKPLWGDRRVVTASLGVAVYRAGDTAATLLRRADAALYRAKRLGRNRVEGPDAGGPDDAAPAAASTMTGGGA